MSLFTIYGEQRSFKLIRDSSVIAYGCIFPNKKCVIAWQGEQKSVVVWDSFEDMKQINGHSNTQIIFY